MRPSSLFQAALLAGALAACGDVSDLPGESPTAHPTSLATIEFDEADAVSLDASAVRISSLGDRQVLLFPKGSDDADARIMTPADAFGAAFVVVRAMADGDFALELMVGGRSAGVKRLAATRRLWKELTFPLPGPLAAPSESQLVLRRLESTTPVAVDSIRFLR